MKTGYFILFSVACFTAFSQVPPVEWQKTYGGSGNDEAWSIVQIKDSGFIIAGATESNDDDVIYNHGSNDVWVVKINKGGTMQWEKTYGGSLGDVAFSMVLTRDGGYAVAGCSNSNDGDVTGNHGDFDFWIIKLDSVGGLMWQKSLGGSYNEVAYSIIQTYDGGYAIAGIDSSNNGDVTGNHGGYDYWVVKLDSAGDLMWQKSLGGSGDDVAYSIIQTVDGGYALAGESGSTDGDIIIGNHGGWDFWVVKLDSAGNILWEKSYGGSKNDGAFSIIQTSDKGCAVAGFTASDDGDVAVNYGITDYWVIKIDSVGVLQWERSFGGSSAEYTNSIIETKTGGYALVGWSESDDGDITNSHGGFDYWVINLDSAGNLIWEKSLGGSDEDDGLSIIQTNDNSFMIVEYSDSKDGDVSGNHGSYDFWIVKLGMAAGVEDIGAYLASIKVYPNPAGDRLNISYESSEKVTEIVINDITGREVQRQSTDLQNTIMQLDVKQLQSGMYFLQLKNGEKVLGMEKFVKE